MRLNSLILIAVLVGLCIPPVPADFVSAAPSNQGPSTHFAVRAATIYTMREAGLGRLDNAWMEILNGRVVRVGVGTPPGFLDVLDLGDATIMPGLVACDVMAPSLRSGREVAAAYVAADRFNPYDLESLRTLWSKGITTARFSPPKNWFVAGVGSVVRLGGRPEEAEVLLEMAGLDIHFDDAGGLNAPLKGEVPLPSSSDVPLIPGQPVRPRSRLGRVAAVRNLLRDARQHALERDGWAHETGELDLTLSAVSRYIGTGNPLRLVARRATDINQAINAARSTGYPCVLSDADEAMAFAKQIAAVGMKVVLRTDSSTGRIGDDSFERVIPRSFDPRTLAALQAANVEVALTRTDGDLLLAAAIAGQGGGVLATAIKGITSAAAGVLGLPKETGRLIEGSSADFVVLNGAPAASQTHAVETWVAGRRVWRRDSSRSLVIRGGTVHDGRGNVYENGAVVIENGRVVDCGTSVGVPPGARVINAGPDAVVTPGFVDGHGHIGISGDGATIDTSVDMAALFVAERPEFRHLAEAGVTTVCVAPKKRSSRGSPLAVIKTARGSHDSLARDPLGAVVLTASGDYKQARASLAGTMALAKKYDDSWKKYDEELAKWKKAEAGKSSKPAAAPKKSDTAKKPEASSDKSPPKADDPITGTWEAEIVAGPMPIPEGADNKIVIKLILGKDNRITGNATSPADPEDTLPVTGKLDGKTVTLEVELPADEIPIPDAKLTITATLDGPDHMSGTMDIAGVIQMDVSAIRVEKGSPVIKVKRSSKKKAPTKGPKKPKFDARLEAFRGVIARKVGVLVAVASGDQMRAAVDVFRGLKMPVALLGSKGAHEVLDSISGDDVGVMLSPGLHRSRRGKTSVFIPTELATARVPFAFQSSAGASAARLPEVASSAVRAGLAPVAALNALTGNAAKMLGLQNTVGSFRAGCDGDVLIFSGKVFQPGTRLLRVFVRGEEVKR